MNIYFDIETGPAPDNEILDVIGEFDPKTVKVGNRGEEKAAEYIAQKESQYLEDARRTAALAAPLGQVLAIGTYSDDGFKLLSGEERELLKEFWALYEETVNVGRGGGHMIGFAILNFDLPFLFRRACRYDLRPTHPVADQRRGAIVDLWEIWRCTERDRPKHSSLHAVARTLQLPGKLEGVTGADFARLWREDRETAIDYVKQDTELLPLIAAKIAPWTT